MQKIKDIINKGENELVEFKASFNKEVIETIVAFANSKGGSVFVGISNSANVVGIQITEESLQNWINEIKTKTSPSIIVDVETHKFKNKTIVEISTQEFPIKPVATQSRYYIRKKNSNHLLSAIKISDLYLKSMQLSWDSYINPTATVANLNKSKIAAFIKKVNQTGRFQLSTISLSALEKLRLIKDDKPTNAAMLLFAKELSDYKIRIGRFKSPSLIISDHLLSGTLFEVLEKGMQIIISHLKFAFEITGKATQRTEIPEYPLNAIREILLNAIVHRDYKSPLDTQIKIFDTKITFFNPGTLYGNLTIEDLKTDNYQSHARNKLIAEAFYLTGDIEKYGSGYQRIRNEISNYPSMKFNFEEIGSGLLLEISYETQKTDNKDSLIELKNDPVNDPVNNRMINAIYKTLVQNKKATTESLSNTIGKSQATIKRLLKTMREKGIIKRIGSHKKGYWDVTNDPINDPVNDPINDPTNIDANNRLFKIIDLLVKNKSLTKEELAVKFNVSIETLKRDIRKLRISGKIIRIGDNKTGYWEVKE